MCTVFEKIRSEGETKGKIEGKIEGEAKGIIEAGFDFGLSEEKILERLQKKLDISIQTAQTDTCNSLEKSFPKETTAKETTTLPFAVVSFGIGTLYFQ